MEEIKKLREKYQKVFAQGDGAEVRCT